MNKEKEYVIYENFKEDRSGIYWLKKWDFVNLYNKQNMYAVEKLDFESGEIKELFQFFNIDEKIRYYVKDGLIFYYENNLRECYIKYFDEKTGKTEILSDEEKNYFINSNGEQNIISWVKIRKLMENGNLLVRYDVEKKEFLKNKFIKKEYVSSRVQASERYALMQGFNHEKRDKYGVETAILVYDFDEKKIMMIDSFSSGYKFEMPYLYEDKVYYINTDKREYEDGHVSFFYSVLIYDLKEKTKQQVNLGEEDFIHSFSQDGTLILQYEDKVLMLS